MPKRQPKPELITPDEVMDSPALRGFDTFLRYRPGDSSIGPQPITPTGETPIGIQPIEVLDENELPIGITPIGERIDSSLTTGSLVPIIRPPKKIRRAVKVQDAHSTGEQALYQALWNEGAPETADSKLIRIGYGGMQSLCGLDKSNCKNNTLSLIKKLAIEVIADFDIRRNEGNTYRVFSYGTILKRRKAAGMEWVMRSRGVQFVKSPIGKTPIGDCNSPVGESPTGAMGETPTGPMGKTPIALRKGIELQERTPSSSVVWETLQPYCKVIDDDAISQLVERCRAVAPDCTEEEIAYFTQVKAEHARSRGSGVHNLMGFLQTAVPRCFEGAAFRKFRTERAKRAEAEQQQRTAAEAETARTLTEQRAILEDPNASEEDKRFARRILDIPEPG